MERNPDTPPRAGPVPPPRAGSQRGMRFFAPLLIVNNKKKSCFNFTFKYNFNTFKQQFTDSFQIILYCMPLIGGIGKDPSETMDQYHERTARVSRT